MGVSVVQTVSLLGDACPVATLFYWVPHVAATVCFQATNVFHGSGNLEQLDSGDCVPSLGISPPGADDDSPNYVNGLC